ncbi:MAG: acyl-CoA dehydrogenase [Pseudomonadota bacterium]
MDFSFSEEQRLLEATVERFAQDRYGNGQRASYLTSDTGFDADGWRLMAETGLLGIPFSEENGGLGGGGLDLVCAMRPLGKSLAVEPLLGGPVLAGSLLERIGAAEQVASWAPGIVDGSRHLALAHAEKVARFHLDYVDARFQGADGRYKLTGHKTFIIAAGGADGFIVSALPAGWSPGGTSRADAMRFFLVEANAEGVSRRQYRLTDGSIACELELFAATAAPMDGGYSDLEAVVARAKIAACAELIGVMELLFEATLDYVKTRKQFKQPLGKFQVIQHRLADLYTSLELSRSHLFRMATADCDSADDRRAISGSKAFIAKAAIALGEEAVQLHGGMGVTDELIIGHGLKRILVLATLFGDPAAEMARFQ